MDNVPCIKCQDNYPDDGRDPELCDKCQADYIQTTCMHRVGCDYETSCQLQAPHLHECPDFEVKDNAPITVDFNDVMYVTDLKETYAKIWFRDERYNLIQAIHQAILDHWETNGPFQK